MTTLIAASSAAPVRLNADARVGMLGYALRSGVFLAGVIGLFVIAGF